VSARSLVQDSGAPAWLSTAARDPVLDLLAPLAADSNDIAAPEDQQGA
jgi:hypothetical protein